MDSRSPTWMKNHRVLCSIVCGSLSDPQTKGKQCSEDHRAWKVTGHTSNLLLSEAVDRPEGKVTVDDSLDVDYESSEPKIEPDTQEEKENNSDAEYANMEIPFDGTFHQRMTPCNVMQRIQWVH